MDPQSIIDVKNTAILRFHLVDRARADQLKYREPLSVVHSYKGGFQGWTITEQELAWWRALAPEVKTWENYFPWVDFIAQTWREMDKARIHKPKTVNVVRVPEESELRTKALEKVAHLQKRVADAFEDLKKSPNDILMSKRYITWTYRLQSAERAVWAHSPGKIVEVRERLNDEYIASTKAAFEDLIEKATEAKRRALLIENNPLRADLLRVSSSNLHRGIMEVRLIQKEWEEKLYTT